MTEVYKGKCVSLKPVEINDAEFIVALRTQENNAEFINETSSNLNDQIAWMINESQDSSSYYFVILNNCSEPIGTISLYNLKDGCGEFGRWICNGSALESLESALLIHQFAFDTLKLREVYTRTLADNQKVVSFHRKFGASVSNNPTFEAEYNKEVYRGAVRVDMYPSIKSRCLKMIEVFL
jgi:RimJ/RimL family protein N-acetyltransferase